MANLAYLWKGEKMIKRFCNSGNSIVAENPDGYLCLYDDYWNLKVKYEALQANYDKLRAKDEPKIIEVRNNFPTDCPLGNDEFGTCSVLADETKCPPKPENCPLPVTVKIGEESKSTITCNLPPVAFKPSDQSQRFGPDQLGATQFVPGKSTAELPPETLKWVEDTVNQYISDEIKKTNGLALVERIIKLKAEIEELRKAVADLKETFAGFIKPLPTIADYVGDKK